MGKKVSGKPAAPRHTGKRQRRPGRWSRWIARLPLRRALFVYVLLFTLAALGLILGTGLLCEPVKDDLIAQSWVRIASDDGRVVLRTYKAFMNASALTLEGEELRYELVMSSDMDARYELLSMVEGFSLFVWPLLCMALAARAFYRRKLREPLGVLREAAQRIGENDLDFSIRYDAPDEMGRLCADFERMRAQVLEHERSLWRAMEERRKQTAALSHDLRTPLTVLKGEAELLEDGLSVMPQERARRTVSTMRGHILRMERYVEGLGEIRRLEDVQVRRERVALGALGARLQETGALLAAGQGKAFALEAEEPLSLVMADTQLVERVFDNLAANALRYACARVEATIAVREERLVLTVRDDGQGFSENALRHADEPFFSEEKTGAQGHLGLGLNIARVLCERCGGALALGNAPEGGACVTADFGPCGR